MYFNVEFVSKKVTLIERFWMNHSQQYTNLEDSYFTALKIACIINILKNGWIILKILKSTFGLNNWWK